VIVTIDGPAGSGKSAAALMLAKRLNAPHLDTGAMYRAVALDALERHLLGDPDAIAARARQMTLTFDWSKTPAAVLLDGRDVSDLIRSPQVTAVTYEAADNPWVREELVRHQRQIGKSVPNLVTEGRDQGSVVFPNAGFKFYLDAHPEERARRRITQLAAKGITAELHDVLHQIVQRDMRDQARAVGPLSRPKDAIVLDTTDMTLEQVVEEMLRIIKDRSTVASVQPNLFGSTS
jgi:cytidylate kinase